MKKNMLFGLFMSLLLVVGFSSCKKDSDPDALITLFSFKTPVVAIGVIDANAKTIIVNVPYGTALNNVTVDVAATSGATITPDPASSIDFSGLSVNFTVKNGGTTTQYTVNVIVGENPLKLILIGEPATINDITNKEIKTAYQWALTNYGEKAKYIPFSALTSEDTQAAKVIWWHQDSSPRSMPAAATAAGVKTLITDFYKAGGNLLLTTHASAYLVELGRLTADYMPTGGGDGPTANANPDNWGISFENDSYDAGNADHALFQGLTYTNVTFEGLTYRSVMMIDGGLKRDHGYFWDFNQIQAIKDLVPDPAAANARKNKFQEVTGSVVRGSFEWDPAANGVEIGTIIEFKPKGAYTGTAIVISCGAYEWYQSDDRTNTFHGNIEGITANAFKYMGVE
jgi:hypothetical protein